MSILGVVVRVRPRDLVAVVPRASTLPGVDLSLNPGDGRLVLVIEDAEIDAIAYSAAATLATIAKWPEVLSTSLVYEYSGLDSPSAEPANVSSYRAWRGGLGAPFTTSN